MLEYIDVAPMSLPSRSVEKLLVNQTSSGHRRGEIKIMRDVLVVCLKGANKTRIVYGANLNFSRVNRYLDILLCLGFVMEVDSPGRVVYKTTEAGVSFLEGCLRMQDIWTKVPVGMRIKV